MYNILKDIRVLDLSRYISGPSCCRILADMGAEVIKVEKAGHGDEGRHCGPFRNGSSLYFSAYNRNKKSVTVDFRSDKGKDVLRRLIEKSDVIVENFKKSILAIIGAFFLVHVFKRLKHKIDPRSYAGATFLGLRGFAFKTHGNSDALAFANSIKYAADLTKANLNGLIEERAKALSDIRAKLQETE